MLQDVVILKKKGGLLYVVLKSTASIKTSAKLTLRCLGDVEYPGMQTDEEGKIRVTEQRKKAESNEQ